VNFFRRKVGLLVFPSAILPLLLLCGIGASLLFQFITAARPVSIYLGYPLKGSRVLIDPGHGGIDPGACYNSVLTEKEIVLAVGLKLKRLLKEAGAEVIMTRETDEDVSRYIPGDHVYRYQRDLKGRVKLINESGADLFLSLHVNHFPDPNIRGAIVFYCQSRPENFLLAQIIQSHINPVVKVNPLPEQYIHQSVKEGDFFVSNYAEIPGVLVEMGFMTSPDDRELLFQNSYQHKLAEALLFGVAEFIYGRKEP